MTGRCLTAGGLAACLALLAVAGCALGGSPGGSPEGSPARCGSRADQYVCAQGRDLVYRGQALRLVGATLYPDVVLDGRGLRGRAWASGAAAFRGYIDHWLDAARQDRMNTIRPTDFLVGVKDWHNAATWRNLDYLVAAAEARHMFVIMDLSAYRNFLRASGQFAYDPGKWASFLHFVGSRYATAPAIAYYAIAGEIEPPNSDDPARATPDQYISFFQRVIAGLHAADHGNHLVSTGGLNHLDASSAVPWKALFALPREDLAALHVYSQDDRNLVVPAVADWAARERKPLVIEEFGFRQDLGDEARAAAFSDTYELGRSVDAAGVVFWNLGPELAPGSYDVSPSTPAVWAAVSRYASLLAAG